MKASKFYWLFLSTICLWWIPDRDNDVWLASTEHNEEWGFYSLSASTSMETPSPWAIKGKSNPSFSFSFFKKSSLWDFKRFSFNDMPQIHHPHPQVYHQHKKRWLGIWLTVQLNRFYTWKKKIYYTVKNVFLFYWIMVTHFLWPTDANVASCYGSGLLHIGS